MKPFLHEKLAKALYLEILSGAYAEGQRFLSYRRICRLWRVSKPTAERALGTLREAGVLETSERFSHRLVRGFRRRALLGLDQAASAADLPEAPRPWRSFLESAAQPAGVNPLAAVFLQPAHSGIHTAYRPDDLLSSASLLCARGCLEGAGSRLLEFLSGSLSSPADADALARMLARRGFRGVTIFHREPGEYSLPLFEHLDPRIAVVEVFGAFCLPRVPALDFNNFAIGWNAAEAFLRKNYRRLVTLEQDYRLLGEAVCERIDGFLARCATSPVTHPGVATMTLPLSALSERDTWLDLRGNSPASRAGLFLPVHLPPSPLPALLQERKIRLGRNLGFIMTSSRAEVDCTRVRMDHMALDFPGIARRAIELLIQAAQGVQIPRFSVFPALHQSRGTL